VKIKLDENVHADVREALARWGHDATTVHEEKLAGRPDSRIADAVKSEERCLVTFDLDFANPRSFPPKDFAGIVVLRLHAPTARLQVRRLVSFFSTQTEGLAGKLWILDEVRARDWTP
jgi:predicted nuclease of predicted toxin-antitoxin system